MDIRAFIEQETVSIVGHRKPVTVTSEATVGEAVEKMQHHSVGCLLVADGSKLLGIFTERDLLRKVMAKDGAASLEDPITAVMTANPVVARADEALAVLLRRMYEGGFRHLPLLDDHERILGTISISRVVGFLADQFAEAVYNLPPRPDHFGTAREGA